MAEQPVPRPATLAERLKEAASQQAGAPGCRHPSIHRLRNEEHDISIWGCDECGRRFYPACEQCVNIGHRSGHGEHHD